MSEVYSGNFASGQTDKITRDTLVAAGPRALLTGSVDPFGAPTYKQPKTPQCAPPVVNRYAGGTTSGVLLTNKIIAAAQCTAAQNLAVAKLRQIPGCPVATDPQVRFIQYQRLPNPVACPVSTINPAIPKALDGPCINLVGINQTWPPH
jgi:hypothetical protein